MKTARSWFALPAALLVASGICGATAGSTPTVPNLQAQTQTTTPYVPAESGSTGLSNPVSSLGSTSSTTTVPPTVNVSQLQLPVLLAVLSEAVGIATTSPSVSDLAPVMASSATPIDNYTAVSGPAVFSATTPSVSVFWTASTDALPSAGRGEVVALLTSPTGPCLLAATNTAQIATGDFSQYAGGAFGPTGNIPTAVGTFTTTISPGQLSTGTFACDAATPQQLTWSPR